MPILWNDSRPWLATKLRGVSVWPGNWAANKAAGKMLRADLKQSRVIWIVEARTDAERREREAASFLAYRDDAGKVADFHALRHTFISRLVRSGARPKEAQTLARHSTITLTMDRYANVGIHDVAAAVEAMPRIPSTDPETTGQPMRATGTDGKIAGTPTGTKLAQTADIGRLRLITDKNDDRRDGHSLDLQKTAEMIAFESKSEQMISGGSEIRTHEYLSVSPVFKTGAINRSAIPP